MAPVAALALASGLLAACGGDSGTPELVWYINPDAGGQDAVAEDCSTDDYTITTQVLPQDAGQQRIQLARRLAAGDAGIDLMSLDPPFTAEFAAAGYLAEIPQDLQQKFSEQAFESAVTAATWEDQLVVAPFWSNTQVLWYRKSFVDQTDLDMSQPVTWDQIIEAADQNDGKIGVQANKYEGYSVWVNALITGAGGQIAENTEAGNEADITIDSEAGQAAAEVIEKLASSEAAPADISVSNEGTAGTTFGSDAGSFLVNWTYIWGNYGDDRLGDDIGFARYPRTVEGEESRPPYGGIGIGVSAFSDEKELAVQALECLTSPESQAVNAEKTGNMPSSPAGYDQEAVKELFPPELIDLFQESLEAAAPRTLSPYWSDISGAIQSTWHPPSSVDEQTPEQSAQFIEDVLQGRRLL
ncbi:sugar ABC transporter substrate-binding protein [Nocardioides flavus (ex Wang et al. 2016)]|uniref:Sugar ABC transporter substrate-binding protein n=1 Tax=Nocardioides flavus (ex Wang et al. 2016) TaxID=2058780 RepID=A0ABQ3HMP2_9ACTN|nr:extracellular solute-binding protein [Nocardioides flavus (ex Wang et al. 2016)]GHE17917.1 sugar ABC transporter substrate-binding protein [Nocardioides flavus (ex Wang et al. 2016)]